MKAIVTEIKSPQVAVVELETGAVVEASVPTNAKPVQVGQSILVGSTGSVVYVTQKADAPFIGEKPKPAVVPERQPVPEPLPQPPKPIHGNHGKR